MTSAVDFDPFAHQWRFVGYYKYQFTFECVDDPTWRVSYGGDSGQIYTYDIGAAPVPLSEATERCCTTPDDWRLAVAGDSEFVYAWRSE